MPGVAQRLINTLSALAAQAELSADSCAGFRWIFPWQEPIFCMRLNHVSSMATKATDSASPGWVLRVLIGRSPKRTLVRLAVWVVILLVIGKFVLLPIRVLGDSMLPTYKDNGVNVVNCLAYLFHQPRRGDVVAIELAGKSVMYLKRIIALPGETIAFHHGHAVINGKVLDEPYVKFPCNWEHATEQVGPDEYYVVGDNRSMDFNEHEQGCAQRRRILGKPLL
jgi:signal peptidase I